MEFVYFILIGLLCLLNLLFYNLAIQHFKIF